MVHLVSYDLLSPGKQYESLFTRLTGLGARRVLMSEWVAIGNFSADDLWKDLNGHVDTNDRLLVNELTRNAQWELAGS